MTASAEGVAAHQVAGAGRPTSGRFDVLDGLRGVASFAIILEHVPSSMVGEFLPGRYLSVDFFFILSGFVLAHAYGARFDKGMTPLAFMKIRLIRLYPLYLLGLAIALIVPIYSILRGWTPNAGELGLVALIGITFIPAPPIYGWMQNSYYPFNSPAWSLFFELVANFIYALIARFLTIRTLLYGLPFAAAFLIFATFNHQGTAGAGWLWPHFDSGLARVLFDFFAGVFLYKLREVWRAPPIPAWLALIAFLVIIGLPITNAARAGYDCFAAIVLLPILVMVSADSRVSGVTARLCGGLGLLSYAVYVLHVPVRSLLDFAVESTGPLPGAVYISVLLVSAAIVAALADRFYDAPMRRWLTDRLVRRKPPMLAPERG